MMWIWKVILSFCAALSPFSAYAAERSFTLANFDSIKVEGDMSVAVTTGTVSSAQARGETDALRRLDLRVHDRTLYVRFNKADAPRGLGGDAGNGLLPVTVRISAPSIRDISLTGDGHVTIDRLDGRSVSAALYGGGSLQIGGTDSADMQLNFNGLGGKLMVAGRTGDLNAIARGQGVLDAAGLDSEDLYVIGEGPVTSRFTATKNARVIVSIDAKVLIFGGAACSVKARKNSEVICKPA